MRYSVAILLAGLVTAVPSASPMRPRPIEQVAWLAGCWALTTSTGTVEEQWMPPRGGAMLSTGRTTRGDALIEYEFVFLSERDGHLAYEAHPSGQPMATFVAATPSDTAVVFENPGHDFPQRVGYHRLGNDSLVGWIDGTIGGKTRRIEFPYQRVSCGGG